MISQTMIDIYKKWFVARTDYYWKYTNNQPYLLKSNDQPVELKDVELIKLLESNNTIGLSPFVDNYNVMYGGIDIDAHYKDDETSKNKLLKILRAKKRMLMYAKELDLQGYTFVTSSSGSDGWHIRIYPPKPIYAIVMREFIAELQIKLFKELVDEIFPKQDELNENTLYGNQMKVPLSYHQKCKNFAVIYDYENTKLLTFEESVNYLIDNIDKLYKIKPIFSNTNIRRVKKSVDIVDGDYILPKYCKVIEEYACNFEFPSGAYIRHHYIDPNVAVYIKDNPDIEYKYLRAQNKPISALCNWRKKLNKFRCWQIQAYLNHYSNNPLMKKCLTACKLCPYNNREVVTEDLNTIRSTN